ncbi:putative LRR receptor-like serine/threonine-protein kinase [Prunus yedoensis var. nudiflora]|uniref:Putative LRR receptor-like serine/threonine-protein kinase n=1 Tax=Prunus yedoensis var. nudiflora TaxID=2094558 RepID=A0A314U8N5_PRUYE|nr:putative LRR receptor-like serine/threonine-protein kinase [Prunus yedoensis var. nudiflora]
MKTLLRYLFLLCFNILLPAVHSQCIKDQQQSLLHLKKSLQFDQPSYSTKVISWNSSTDCCSWVGVNCTSNGHVVGLDLSCETISGGIDNASSLFHLQHLQSLNLACNDFDSGTGIPSAIGKLVNLRYLNLSNNGYYGQIPIEISRLSRLVVLDISQSVYSLVAPNISILFQNLTELAELYFDHVYLSAQGANWSQAISSSLPNLRVLSLCSTGLSDPIDESLGKLQSLSVIQLGENYISGPIPGSFANFSNLTVLDLSQNNISGPIPGFFANFSNLRVLDLSWNNISGPIPGSFANFSNLRVLDLRGNSISGPIPGSFANFSNLRVLGLSWNNISGTVPGFFANFSKLTSLGLSGCRLNGIFPNEIFQLQQFEGQISVSIFNFRGLQSLDLSSNNFNAFPFNGPQQLKNLTNIDLSYNSLLSLYNVKTVDLHSNQLQGQFPTFPPSAKYLDYSRNNFNSIPSNIGDFITNTLFFSLSSNNLHGLIPASICNASNIQILNLSNNSLSGMIPQCLTTMRDLSVLNLARNNLTGSISNVEVTEDSSLQILEIGGNQLGGQVPKSLAKCTMLENISTLRVLILRSNNFYGGIECLNTNGTWPGLQIIDLAHNNFSGEIHGILWRTWREMVATENGSLSTIVVGSHTQRKSLICKNPFDRKCHSYGDGSSSAYDGSSLEYGVSVTVTSKGFEMELQQLQWTNT